MCKKYLNTKNKVKFLKDIYTVYKLYLIFIEFITSHNNKFNNKINISICIFFNWNIFDNTKKNGPKNKIDAKTAQII